MCSSDLVTFDDSGGGISKGKKFLTVQLPLPETHTLYNPEDPNKLYPQEVLRQRYSSNINTNVWANTPDDADNITTQIKTIFNKTLSFDYHFCYNYDKISHLCSTTALECEAISNNFSRGIRNQCPSPSKNNFMTIPYFYNIIMRTFDFGVEYSLDDLDIEQEMYRTVLPVKMDYYTYYTLGGNPINNLYVTDLGE